ncbi:MAG: hypothetical protein AMXMBFR33_12390 [Candidatus Xenobia bacterium]
MADPSYDTQLTWSLRLALILVLGISVVETPGVTAPPPALTLMAAASLTVLSGLAMISLRLCRVSLAGLIIGLCLAGWSALASRESYDPFLSQLGFASWVAGAGVLSTVLLTASSGRTAWRETAHAILALILAISCYGLLLSLRGGGWARATFTNSDCFSLLPLLGLLLVFGLLPRSTGGEQSYLLVVSGALAIAVFLSGSRAGALGLMAGIGCYVLLSLGRQWGTHRILVVMLIPLLMGGMLVILMKGPAALSKWTSLASGNDTLGVTSRLSIVKVGVPLGLEHPIFGTGPGTFHLAYQSRRPPTRGEDYMNVAHNDYVQILVEMGVPGLLLWLGLVGLAAGIGVYVTRHESSSEHAGATAGIIAMGVYALGNFAVPVPADLMFSLAVVGLALTHTAHPPSRYLPQIVVAVALVLLGASSLRTGLAVWQNNRALARAQILEGRLDWPGGIEALNQAGSRDDIRILLAQAHLWERQGLLTEDRSRLDRAGETLRRARALSPLNLLVILRLADVEEARGHLAEAALLLEQANRQAPHTEYVRLAMIRNQVLRGDLAGAAEGLSGLTSHPSPGALGEILALLELSESGRGLELLKSRQPLTPGLARAARRAGTFCLERKDLQAARAFFELAAPIDRASRLALAKLETDPARRLTMLAELLNGPDSEETQEARLLWGHEALTRKEFDQVVAVLEPVLVSEPESVRLRLLLSQAYVGQKRISEASRVLEDGFDFDQGSRLHDAHKRLSVTASP